MLIIYLKKPVPGDQTVRDVFLVIALMNSDRAVFVQPDLKVPQSIVREVSEISLK